MNILFLTLANIGTISGGGIYTDLMRQFVRNGHQVFIVSPSEKRYQRDTRVIREEQCVILKVRTGNIKKSRIAEKALATLAIGRQYKRGIEQHFQNVQFDLVLYSTPPITLAGVVEYIKKRDGILSYLLLKDIFPQNSVDLGMIPAHGLIHRYFRRKEIALYKQADFIGCMSEANVNYVRKHNPFIAADSIEICPNSIEPISIQKNVDEVKKIRMKYEIPIDKTVFIYGGNLGRAQGIDFLIKCLQINEASDQAFVLIVGDGTEFERLSAVINGRKFRNAKIIWKIPKLDYDVLANTCDVGLIFLDSRFTIPNFPSRLLSYMQASMPVLAFTDKNTDIGQVIENGKFGLWAESGDLQAFRQNIALLCNNPKLREGMGVNARSYLERHYTVEQTYEIIMRHFIA